MRSWQRAQALGCSPGRPTKEHQVPNGPWCQRGIVRAKALACMQHEVKLLMLVRCRVQVITAYDNVRLQPDTLIQIIADKVSKA